jgi:hypothetical protein
MHQSSINIRKPLPYLVRAFANCLQSLIRTMIGYAKRI